MFITHWKHIDGVGCSIQENGPTIKFSGDIHVGFMPSFSNCYDQTPTTYDKQAWKRQTKEGVSILLEFMLPGWEDRFKMQIIDCWIDGESWLEIW